jgi:predicted ArsR family transcriptional regulator
VIRLVAGDVQLLELLAAGSSRPTWELASILNLSRASAAQQYRRLEAKGAVRRSWRGHEEWWALSERGKEALEVALAAGAKEANNRCSSRPAA